MPTVWDIIHKSATIIRLRLRPSFAHGIRTFVFLSMAPYLRVFRFEYIAFSKMSCSIHHTDDVNKIIQFFLCYGHKKYPKYERLDLICEVWGTPANRPVSQIEFGRKVLFAMAIAWGRRCWGCSKHICFVLVIHQYLLYYYYPLPTRETF